MSRHPGGAGLQAGAGEGAEGDERQGSQLCTGPQGPELSIYHRRLPHWRLHGSTYFVTWRLERGQGELQPHEREVVLRAVRHFDNKRYELWAYAVMDDHVHALVTPFTQWRLEAVVNSWKSYSARRIQHGRGIRGPLWQREYYDRIIRDEREFLEKAQYILDNPFKRWPELQDYEWAGFVQRDHVQ